MFFKTHEPVKKLTTSELKEFPKLRKTNFKIFLHRTVSWKNCLWASLWKDDTVREFQTSVKKAFTDTAIYMQQKFPLSNRLLISLTGLDLVIIGIFPTIVTELWLKESYMCEISYIQLDGKLPPTQTDKDLTVWL